MSIRRETHDDDDLRTEALLDAADAYINDAPSEQYDVGFGAVLVDGLACGSGCTDYPPAGHSYPRRG